MALLCAFCLPHGVHTISEPFNFLHYVRPGFMCSKNLDSTIHNPKEVYMYNSSLIQRCEMSMASNAPKILYRGTQNTVGACP